MVPQSSSFSPPAPAPAPAPALAPLPRWISAARPQTTEETAFCAGAALAHLHGEIARPEVPRALLRARLALGAAQAVLRLEGRREVLAALRDAVHLLGPRDQPDPLGAVWLLWRQAAARPLAAIGVALPEVPERWRAAALGLGLELGPGLGPGVGQGGLTHRFAAVLQQILDEDPRAETPALILAEAAFSRALGWDHLTPLIVAGLRPGDLRLRGADLRRACEAALLRQAPEVMQMAIEVTRGAGRLRAVAPKLRAKGAGQAVALFLSRDALAPRDLAPRDLTALMSDRAARRLCERLVELGAVRELTGRDSFRLYGV